MVSLVFRDHHRIPDFSHFKKLISSRLIMTECFRTLHRLLADKSITESTFIVKGREFRKAFLEINLVEVSGPILERAMQAFPTHVKTLDAIHLSSALLWREIQNEELIFLTHDEKLGRAAELLGFETLGPPRNS